MEDEMVRELIRESRDAADALDVSTEDRKEMASLLRSSADLLERLGKAAPAHEKAPAPRER